MMITLKAKNSKCIIDEEKVVVSNFLYKNNEFLVEGATPLFIIALRDKEEVVEYEEGIGYKETNMFPLKLYLESKLMWDTSLSTSTLITKFCNAYFGAKAAPYMIQYLNRLDRTFKKYN